MDVGPQGFERRREFPAPTLERPPGPPGPPSFTNDICRNGPPRRRPKDLRDGERSQMWIKGDVPATGARRRLDNEARAPEWPGQS